jgi:hypothetical protein
MSKMREKTRVPRGTIRPPGPTTPPERKLVLSGLVHRRLVSFNERGQQRRVLLNVLILAQALLMLAAAPEYVNGTPSIIALATVLASLVSCLIAALFNQFFRNPVRAAYILVIGGATGVLVLVVYSAVVGNALEAAHTSLLLVPVMLETGLLFAPEVTLLTAGVSLALTIAALLFALAVNAPGSRQETYGLVVDILGVQMVSGLIAWLLAQFIYESAVEAQRAQEQQFAQARLEAMTAQTAEQHQRLEAAIAAMQQTLGRAINGDYSARITVADGPLAVLSASLNMLLERLSAVSQGDVMRQRMEAAALPLIDVVGRVPDGGTPLPASLPVMTNTPMDTVSVAVGQMQASVGRRLQRVQELAGEVVGGLAHTHGGITSTAQSASESLRTVGVVIAAADTLLSAARRDVDLAARALRIAGTLRLSDGATLPTVPDEMAELSGLDGAGNSLVGLGADLGVGVPGLTGVFGMLSQEEAKAVLASTEAAQTESASAEETAEQEAGETSGHPAPTKRPRAGKASKPEETSPAVIELLRLLETMRDEVSQQERSATTLVHELGIVNRNVRGVDVGIAWARQALEAVRRNAEKLLQTAGGATAAPTFQESVPISTPITDGGLRGAAPSRVAAHLSDEAQAAVAHLAGAETGAAARPDHATPPDELTQPPARGTETPAPESNEARGATGRTGEADLVRASVHASLEDEALGGEHV